VLSEARRTQIMTVALCPGSRLSTKTFRLRIVVQLEARNTTGYMRARRIPRSKQAVERFATAIDALDDPKNEPLRWLLGEALRRQAVTTIGRHFLLETLAEPVRSPVLAWWNARLHQFRELLRNPGQAPIKATTDLRCGPKDAQKKLGDFLAEVIAAAHLHSLGYAEFSVVLAEGNKPMPDFLASFEGQPVAVEVKNLQEPADILRNVAGRHWKELTEAQPERYGFRVVLRHQRCGRLTAAAQQRLCNILTQLPDIKKYPYTETLDGGIAIQIELVGSGSISPGEPVMLDRLTAGKKSQLAIVTGISVNDLSRGIDEVQALFLKSLRIVAEATPKFFSESYSPEHRNVVALHWNPPEFIYDPEMLIYINDEIEKLFEAFSFQLTPVLFCDPPIPWPLLHQYT